MTKQWNCLIVEDEPLAAEILEDYIAQIPFLCLKGNYRDAFTALDILQQNTIDLLFLDIHLPKLKGLDFLRTLHHPPQVIITSAYQEYALEGYELNVLDYLLKPIEFSRFLMAVNKLPTKEKAPVQESIQEIPIQKFIFINTQKKRVKVFLDDILFIEAQKEYIKITTKDHNFLTKLSLNQIEEQLGKEDFIRVHRSFIVAVNKIEAYTATGIEIKGYEIPIGRNYKVLVQMVLDKF